MNIVRKNLKNEKSGHKVELKMPLGETQLFMGGACKMKSGIGLVDFTFIV